MNLVILIGSAQMFIRSFGLRHLGGAFGDLAMELAGTKARRVIITLFARPVEWLQSRLGGQVFADRLLLCGALDKATLPARILTAGAANDTVEQALSKTKSRGAATRRRLNVPETVTDTDMFNILI
jgi:hypothetical protein